MVGHAVAVGGTVEPTGTKGTGVLSGLGSQFMGFTRVKVDSGATWTVDASIGVLGGTTIIGAGGNDALVVTDSGTIALSRVTGFPAFELSNAGANRLRLTDANFAGGTGGTITINGWTAADTIALSKLSRDHTVVINGGGGDDVVRLLGPRRDGSGRQRRRRARRG